MSQPGGADVVVVGAGVMGGATAFALAERGVRVTLVEGHRPGGPPSGSGASAAIVEALAGSPAPLAAQATLARRLLHAWSPRLLDLTGIDVEFQRIGTVRLAFSEREAGVLRGPYAALYADLGEESEWLDAPALREAEPAAFGALAETGAAPRRPLGGLLIPGTNGLYAPRYTAALAAGAAARGATVLTGTTVTGFDVSGDRVLAVRTSAGTLPAGAVVVAAGAWTGVVSGWLGRPLPVGPQKGQIMALAPAADGQRVRHVVHGPGGYIIPKANGTACVGATHDDVGFDARVTTGGLRFLADLALRLAPGLEGASLRHVWAGFRPVLGGAAAGALPALGPVPGLANVAVAAGHGAIGVTVSAAAGHLLAQHLTGERPDLPLEPFAPANLLGAR